MSRKSFFHPFMLLFAVLTITACADNIVDKLMPETQHFLTQQEKARCSCLEQHGKTFEKKIKEGIQFIENSVDKYNIDSLSIEQFYAIRLGIVEATSQIKILTECIQPKVEQPDQLTAMLIQEDLRVVLNIDSTFSEQQKFEAMNKPGSAIMQNICPQHLDKMELFYQFIQLSTQLPKGLQ